MNKYSNMANSYRITKQCNKYTNVLLFGLFMLIIIIFYNLFIGGKKESFRASAPRSGLNQDGQLNLGKIYPVGQINAINQTYQISRTYPIFQTTPVSQLNFDPTNNIIGNSNNNNNPPINNDYYDNDRDTIEYLDETDEFDDDDGDAIDYYYNPLY